MAYYLSPSTINLFKECERCFWLKFRKGISRPDTIFPSLPSGIDRVLKTHFDKFRKNEELPPELESLKGFRLFNKMDYLRKWRDGYGISYKLGENSVRGKIDELLTHDGQLVMIDFKTKGSAPHENSHTYYLDQLSIYGWLFEKNGFFVKKKGYLVFYYPDIVKETGEFKFGSELKEIQIDTKRADRLINSALKALEGDLPNPSPKCSFCEWRERVNHQLKDT